MKVSEGGGGSGLESRWKVCGGGERGERIHRAQVPGQSEPARYPSTKQTCKSEGEQQARRLPCHECSDPSVIAREDQMSPDSTLSPSQIASQSTGKRTKPNNRHRDKDVGRASRSFGDDTGSTTRERLGKTGQAKGRALVRAGPTLVCLGVMILVERLSLVYRVPLARPSPARRCGPPRSTGS